MLYTMSVTVQLSSPPDKGKKNPLAPDFLKTSHRKAEGS